LVCTSDLPSVQGSAEAKRTVDQYIQQREQVVAEFKRKAIGQQTQQPEPLLCAAALVLMRLWRLLVAPMTSLKI
jgi:hypothetical protein